MGLPDPNMTQKPTEEQKAGGMAGEHTVLNAGSRGKSPLLSGRSLEQRELLIDGTSAVSVCREP